MRARGFTLLEVLIALSIFALIGVGTAQLLKSVIDTRDITESHALRLNGVQRALAVIERDLVQVANRAIRDELGDPRPPLVVGEEPYALEFTRAGWRNPGRAKRSELQRVAYSWEEEELRRHYWLVLDRAEDSEPVTQVLLSGVDDLRIDVMTPDGMSTYLWPEEIAGEEQAPGLPARVQVTLLVKEVGEVARVFDLVAMPRPGQGKGRGGDDRSGGARDSANDAGEAQ